MLIDYCFQKSLTVNILNGINMFLWQITKEIRGWFSSIKALDIINPRINYGYEFFKGFNSFSDCFYVILGGEVHDVGYKMLFF